MGKERLGLGLYIQNNTEAMMIDTHLNTWEANNLMHQSLEDDKELQLLASLANAKFASLGKSVRILLKPKGLQYATGYLWWRKVRNVTRYELIHLYTFKDKQPMFKSYNWPSIPGDENKGSFRPYGTPGQVKTYLEAITNI
jgi:hypothetical protein